MCQYAGVSRSGYYKWLGRKNSESDLENYKILKEILNIHNEVKGIYGYRRMTMNINIRMDTHYNLKRIYRLMNENNIKSVIRRKKRNYKYHKPQIIAENILSRDFSSDKLNEKWLTDVTEFKISTGEKLYLSPILDLCSKRIVSYTYGKSNNNELVFNMLDKAIASNPEATPLIHSDRGYQYTSKSFKYKLDKFNATQSMSRPGKCIDNGPMEGFFGILKSEMFYLNKYDDLDNLKSDIDEYVKFYNSKRYQKNLKNLSPNQYREQILNR